MKKILIVEDETTISIELQKLLQNSGYEATILKDFTNSKENKNLELTKNILSNTLWDKQIYVLKM